MMGWIALITVWLACSVAAFLLFERFAMRTFERFSRGDAIFWGVLALAGPLTLFWALVCTAIDALGRPGPLSKPFRTRSRNTQP